MNATEKELERLEKLCKEKRKEFEVLKDEKQKIIQRFEKASPNDRKAIQLEMAKSIERFEALSDEVTVILEKTEKLKKIIQGS